MAVVVPDVLKAGSVMHPALSVPSPNSSERLLCSRHGALCLVSLLQGAQNKIGRDCGGKRLLMVVRREMTLRLRNQGRQPGGSGISGGLSRAHRLYLV